MDLLGNTRSFASPSEARDIRCKSRRNYGPTTPRMGGNIRLKLIGFLVSAVQNSVGRKSNDRLVPINGIIVRSHTRSTLKSFMASVGGDGLHAGHITTQSGAHDLNRVRFLR